MFKRVIKRNKTMVTHTFCDGCGRKIKLGFFDSSMPEFEGDEQRPQICAKCLKFLVKEKGGCKI